MKRHISPRAGMAAGAALIVAVAGGTAVAQATDNPGATGASSKASAARHHPGKPSKAEIAELFDQWNATLQTGDPEKVADRYASDAVLLPTASPKIRTNRAEIVDYFEHFLLKHPKGEKVHTVINVLDHNSAIDAGLYRFHVTTADGTKSTIDARYSYEYEKRGGEWLIVSHHSSVLPAES